MVTCIDAQGPLRIIEYRKTEENGETSEVLRSTADVPDSEIKERSKRKGRNEGEFN